VTVATASLATAYLGERDNVTECRGCWR